MRAKLHVLASGMNTSDCKSIICSCPLNRQVVEQKISPYDVGSEDRLETINLQNSSAKERSKLSVRANIFNVN